MNGCNRVLLRLPLRRKDDVGARELGRFVFVPDTDDGDVVDEGAGEESCFESAETEEVSMCCRKGRGKGGQTLRAEPEIDEIDDGQCEGERGGRGRGERTWKPLTLISSFKRSVM